MTNTAQKFDTIVHILHAKPAADISELPPMWREMSGTGLSDGAKALYLEAAQLFRYHRTRLGMEALSTLGSDFRMERYPDFAALSDNVTEAGGIEAGVKALFREFGYEVPASFYNVILMTASKGELEMFHDEGTLMRDRLLDAVLHGMLLVTPVALRIHSVLSQHGARFSHIMDCGCEVTACEERFEIALDPALRPAYLQNMLAAAFEQYGTNATTSGTVRGF